jgi:hypothetical protein
MPAVQPRRVEVPELLEGEHVKIRMDCVLSIDR